MATITATSKRHGLTCRLLVFESGYTLFMNVGATRKKRIMRIMDAYGDKCIYCGILLTLRTFTIEHVIPRSKGGTNDLENLRPACDRCNSGHMNPLEANQRVKEVHSDPIRYSLRKQQRKLRHQQLCWQSCCIPHAWQSLRSRLTFWKSFIKYTNDTKSKERATQGKTSGTFRRQVPWVHDGSLQCINVSRRYWTQMENCWMHCWVLGTCSRIYPYWKNQAETSGILPHSKES